MTENSTKQSIPLARIFVKGGVISPADLLRVMDASKKAGNSFIMFGSRQDILFPAMDTDEKELEASLEETDLKYHITDSCALKEPFQKENIVSSYVAVNVTVAIWWLKEDVYHYILDSFDYQPTLKVNIIDPIQSLVPLFTGHLNFIASKQEHYWHLYIRREGSRKAPEPWPALIHEHDIAKAAKHIETELLKNPDSDIQKLFQAVNNEIKIHCIESEEKPATPTALFPYYEGLNAMQNHFYWLGLYWRNNRFDIEFLSAACRLCQDTRVGKISITPWKSFVIKGIRDKHRVVWEQLTGRFGINLRHSSLELNWHLPVMDEEALKLKRYLVRELDQYDISTHGLTFTIKTAERMLLFTSVVIEKNLTDLKTPEPSYNILYSRDFNPNQSEYICFARSEVKSELPGLLIQLSKLYFRGLEAEEIQIQNNDTGSEKPELPSIYQCRSCLTVYDKKYGDPGMNIEPGTAFEKLPDDYLCPVCSGAKEAFVPVAGF